MSLRSMEVVVPIGALGGATLEGHILADIDLGLLVVGGQDVGGREDVQQTVLVQCLEYRRHIDRTGR